MKVTGRVFVKINGSLQRSKAGASLDVGGFTRTSVMTHEVLGYTEEPKPSRCEFTLAHVADTDLIALRDLVDAEIEFECDTGVKYVVPKAWCVEPPKLTGGQGDVSVVLEGTPAFQS